MATPSEPTRPGHDATLAEQMAVPGGLRPEVWYAAAAERRGVLSPQLARRLLDAHTQTGDLVIDVDDDVAFAAAAAETDRRHHALGGDNQLATLGHAAGYVDLILLHWPRPQANPRWLLVACRALLRPNGRLVIAVAVPAAQRVPHLSALAGAAHTAELDPVGHLAAVDATHTSSHRRDNAGRTAVSTGDATPDSGVDRSCIGEVVQPHADLLVFQPRAGSDV
jgi:hypothetical protein